MHAATDIRDRPAAPAAPAGRLCAKCPACPPRPASPALHVAAPLVSVRAFARRAFGMSSAAMFIYSGALFGFMVVIPVYFQVVRGESPLRAGLLLAPLGLGAIITMSLSGRLTDRIAARWIVMTGMIIVVAGAVVFTQIHVGTSLAILGGALFAAGLGHGAILPPAMGSSYQGMPGPEIPAATAAYNVIIRVGSSFGTAALAVVLQQAIRNRIPGASGGLSGAAGLRGPHVLSELTSAFGVSFWWVAALVALAIIPAAFIPARHGGPARRRAASAATDDESAPRGSSDLVTE